jgi:hypothetical protein
LKELPFYSKEIGKLFPSEDWKYCNYKLSNCK